MESGCVDPSQNLRGVGHSTGNMHVTSVLTLPGPGGLPSCVSSELGVQVKIPCAGPTSLSWHVKA